MSNGRFTADGNLTVLDLAYFAWAAYHNHAVDLRGFRRHSHSKSHEGNHFSGFHGAVFRRTSGTGTDRIVAISGTELKGFGQSQIDAQADLGFGGETAESVARMSPWKKYVLDSVSYGAASSGVNFVQDGLSFFQAQGARTIQLALAEQRLMNVGDRLFIVGHSLGGGLAQIGAAKTGISAVTFNGVAVGALADVVAAYQKTNPRVMNFRFTNDPVNNVEMFTQRGKSFLGSVHWLRTGRVGLDAHSIELDIKELKPDGLHAGVGAKSPFAL